MDFIQNGINGKNCFVIKGNKIYNAINGKHLYTVDNGVLKSATTAAVIYNVPVFSEPSGIDLSFISAGSGDILSGKVGADKDGNPVNGSILTVTPSLSGNKFTVEKGYVPEAKELTVPEAEAPTVNRNTVTIYPGYVAEETTVETEGGSSGGAMEIYKCAAVHEASAGDGYIVSGCGNEDINGTYTQDTSRTDFAYVYVNENGCEIRIPGSSGEYMFIMDSTLNGPAWLAPFNLTEDISTYVWEQGPNGVAQAPTVTATEGSPASWSGYKYDFDSSGFSKTLTEGLEYGNGYTPVIGSIYNKNATMRIASVWSNAVPTEGMVFYAPLTVMQSNAETGQQMTVHNTITYSDNGAHFGDSGFISFPADALPVGNGERTISGTVTRTSTPSDDYCILFYGVDSSNKAVNIALDYNGKLKIDKWQSDIRSINSIPENTPTHFAVTFDGSTVRIYIDGILDSEHAFTFNTSTGTTAYIGDRLGNLNYHFDNGTIKNLRVYSRALNKNEIKAITEE